MQKGQIIMKKIILITLISILSTVSLTCGGGVSTKIPEVGLTYHEESLILDISQKQGRFKTSTTDHESPISIPTARPKITSKSSLPQQSEKIQAPQNASSPKSTYVDDSGYVPTAKPAKAIPIDSEGSIEKQVGCMGNETPREKIYVEGFGYIESSGPNIGSTADSDGSLDIMVGSMD